MSTIPEGIEDLESLKTAPQITAETPDDRSCFLGESLWAALPVQSAEAVFTPEESLTLSPSSLGTYMECPRKYYYGKILGIRTESSEQANMGTLIHRLLEILNQNFEGMPYTGEQLLTLAELLFDPEASPEQLLGIGFDKDDLDRLNQMTALARHDLQARLLAAVTDLEAKGYFRNPIRSIRPEADFKEIAIDGLERCKFTTRIDALLEREDGSWEIVDYKFYGPGMFNLKTLEGDGHAKRLLSALEPLPEGNLPHGDRFKTTSSKPRDPQLIMYYLATQQDPDLQGKVKEASLQIIRPPFPDNPQQGSIKVTITHDQIEAGLDQWKQDVQTYVVKPILDGTAFEINTGRHCGLCDYFTLCDSRGDLGDGLLSGDEEGAEA